MMNEIIMQQQVNRRASSATVPPKPQNGAYTVLPQPQNLMTQIKQQPAPVQRYYKKPEPELPVIHQSRSTIMPQPIIDTPVKPTLKREFSPPAPPDTDGPRKPSIRPRIIIALGGVAVFALIALNWQQIISALKTSLLSGGVYSLDPGSDRGLEQNLAKYGEALTQPQAADGEEIPLNMIETFAWDTYTVRRGDNISTIAKNFSISMDAVIASNNISSAKLLQVGEKLRIPNMDGIPYTVKKNDSLLEISQNMGVPLEIILKANDIQDDNILAGTQLFIPGAKMKKDDLKIVLGDLFIYPIRGRLTSPFGWRNDPISGVRQYHSAIDLAASTGTPIKAAMDGKISTVGLNSTYGKYIIITHSNGYQTMYAHMSATSVKQGAYVYQGSKIGEVGGTDSSTGPRLHFAVYKNGRPVNPLDLLKS